jgi:hypothetical protein
MAKAIQGALSPPIILVTFCLLAAYGHRVRVTGDGRGPAASRPNSAAGGYRLPAQTGLPTKYSISAGPLTRKLHDYVQAIYVP